MSLQQALSEIGIQIDQQRVGEGGSAVVHRGHVDSPKQDGLPPIGTEVAVKEYKPSILQVSGQRERIIQEGTVGRSLDHPNLAKVYYASVPDSDGDPCFLVMEWINGDTLDAWGETLRKNVSWERMRRVCDDIVNGLEALHSKNILHRDIKPENVMVVDDRAKIMDIGVAELTDDNAHTMHTAVKDFVGSIRYASPQFIMGSDAFTPADDIYSLGATMLELLSGTKPYGDITRKPVLPILVTRRAPQVGSLRESVPPGIETLLEGCLNHDRRRRPSLHDVRETLRVGGESSYVQKELERQAADQRGYEILCMDGTEGGFFADLGPDQPETGKTYRIVRRCAEVLVPSLNARVTPERWIAEALLRHIHQNLGHFKLLGRRWVESRQAGFTSLLQSGHWEDFEKSSEHVKIGDFVAKTPEQ